MDGAVLAASPATLASLASEVEQAVGDDAITADHLARMPYLNGVVSETLRLGSPGCIAGRWIDAPFEVRGHTLPAGPFVFYVPYVTHRMQLWPEPLAFRPGRWIDDHEHHHRHPARGPGPVRRRRPPVSRVGLRDDRLKVLAVELVRAVGSQLTAARASVEPTGLASMAPLGGVHVSVT